MDVIPELLRAATAGGEIVLALDSDQAGKQAARQLAAALISSGIAPTRIRLFEWPAKDANEYLLGGGDAGTMMQRMKASPLWLEMMIAAAAPGESGERGDESALQELFRALACLSTFELSHFRELTCQRLKLRKSVFDNLLQSVRRESIVNGNGDCRYQVHAGHLVQRTHDAAGNQILNPLCNFSAWIEQDVLHDNGQDVERVLHIGGRLNNMRLPQANVKATEFSRLDWVLREWGSAAIIEPGSQRREHLRAAIQHLSRGVQQKRVYTHTGWLKSAQGRVYLSSGGAVTASSCGMSSCAGAAGMEDRAAGSAGWDGVGGEPLRIANGLQDQGIGGNVVGETEGIYGQGNGVDGRDSRCGRDGDCGIAGVPGAPTMNGAESSFDFGNAGRIDGGDSGMEVRDGRCGVAGMPSERKINGGGSSLGVGEAGWIDKWDGVAGGGDGWRGEEACSSQDAEAVTVELDGDLALYNLPTSPRDASAAMSASLSYLEIAPARVTFPLWAAMWLAPLRELVSCAFSLWVYGATGTLKSTLAALALNHYGPGFDDKHLPASFTDTVNRLEQKAFTIKDAPLVLDDYSPQKEWRSNNEYLRIAHRIVRGMGNQVGRGRLSAASTPLKTYTPRALLIITGEDLPNSQSLVARLFVVEINQGDVEREKLSRLQDKKAHLAHAMSAYLSWTAANWNGLAQTIPARWRHYRAGAIQAGLHLRLPEAVASLSVGMEMGLRFAAYLGQIDGQGYQVLLEQGRAAFADGSRMMLARLQEEKPEEMFVRTLKELLAQGKIYLQRLGESQMPGDRALQAEMLGWQDEEHLYLLPQAAYNRISRHYRDQGDSFPVRESTLRKMLNEAGALECDANRLTRSVYIGGKSERVLILKRKIVGL